MKKTVLVRGPALTQSGYGEHTRFVLRALRLQEDHLDIHVLPVNWGETGWLSIDDEERRWIDSRVEACKNHTNAKLPYDFSIQVTIPNEWQRIAPVNIGVTAGIETNKVAPIWIQKANEMDKIVVVSEHAKKGFTDVVYHGHNPSTGQPVELRCTTPIEVAHYPVKDHQAPETPILELDYDFNFLAVAQWGPRKNVANLIKWFVEENMDQEVGLVLKTSIKNNSYVDREHMEQLVRSCVPDIPERKCKVYLLHGDLTEAEMHSLYVHPKIKAMVSLTHGEGFGLPLFEAAYSGLPIIAPGWSGQTDFLFAPFESKSKKSKGKEVLKPHFAEIDFTMGPVPREAVWQGVIEKDMSWCYPTEGSFKLRMRQVRNSYDKWVEKAEKLKKYIIANFEKNSLYDKFINFAFGNIERQKAEYVFVSDLFHDQYSGGAELSLKTLIDATPGSKAMINSTKVSKKTIDFYKDSKWIFGNITNLQNDLIQYIIDSGVEYSFVEFDYKMCKHRNPILYDFIEGETCNYAETDRGGIIQDFIISSKSTFFMSEGQKQVYEQHLPAISDSNTHILSSLFDDSFFDKIDTLNRKYQDQNRKEKWVVLGSNSWVKGALQSENWCKENNKDYDMIFGVEYNQFLEQLAQAKGLCALPAGYDTCPRLVIEAKLLGCELQTNEYVQHRDEKWFSGTSEQIVNYLKTRKDYFWMYAFND